MKKCGCPTHMKSDPTDLGKYRTCERPAGHSGRHMTYYCGKRRYWSSDEKATVMYSVTVNYDQMAVLSHALEVYARLGIGQFRSALECLPISAIGFPDGWHEDMEKIGVILSKYTVKHVDYGYSSSVDKKAKIAWDIYQALRYRLAWDDAVEKGIIPSIDAPRKWPEMYGVSYDEPMVISDQPLPTIRKET